MAIGWGPAPTLTGVSPSVGTIAGGTPATLRGKNFLPGASVTFCGTPATDVSVVSASQINVTTPAYTAGSCNILVKNPDSQTATLPAAFRFERTDGTPCAPATCFVLGKDCGTVSDGCGGYLDCGACTAPATCGGGGTPNECAVPTSVQTYSTNFPLTENPISEAGVWLNGQTEGLDWANVQTTSGFAFGTQLIANTTINMGSGDSTALLAGTWGPDQTVKATVHVVTPHEPNLQFIELRLRSTLTPHSSRGYVVVFQVLQGDPSQPTTNPAVPAISWIERWNGTPQDITYPYPGIAQSLQYAVNDGDVIEASIVGSTITAYLNGVQINQAVDTTFTTGNPGFGFFVAGADLSDNFGLSSFTVTAQ